MSTKIKRSLSVSLILFTVATLSGESIAEDQFTGSFSSVTESDCHTEVEFLANGKGEFRELCNTEGASSTLSVIRTDFSWYQQAEKIIVSLPNSKKAFEYRTDLSCNDFGYSGNSPGVVSDGISYFKIPIDCK